MICPNCHKDYKDTPPGIPHGYFYRSDDHSYKEERRFGIQCTQPNCGFLAEIIARPTGNPYRKREMNNTDVNTMDLFDAEEMSFEDFQNELGKHADKTLPHKTVQSIIHEMKDGIIKLVISPRNSSAWVEIFLLMLHAAHRIGFNLFEESKKQFDEVKTSKGLKHVAQRTNT